MATTKHKAYTTSTSLASMLTTELNSLANNANTAASSALDNRTALDMFLDLRLVVATQGSARSTGGLIIVYIVPALDDSTYDAVHETTAEIIATFPLDAATTARQLTRRDIPVPPGLFKVFARNQTGQALAASGNTVAGRYHSVETA